MIPYFVLYSFIIIFYFTSSRVNIGQKEKKLFYFIFLITIIIFTGLRTETGGDWITYEYNYRINGQKFDITNYSIRSDYAWELISYLCYKIGFSLHFLNLLSSIFFFICLNKFIDNYNSKILVYIIVFPVTILVLLMGYSRQAMAFAFLLLILESLFNDKFFKASIYLFIGIFFHKSLILFIFIFLLFPSKILKKINAKTVFKVLFLIAILLAIPTYIFLREDLYSLYINYFGYRTHTNPTAKGVYQRWLINFLPSLLFLIFFKKFQVNPIEKKIFLSFSLISIFSILIIPLYATGTDRYLYYFSIIQIFVFARLPLLIPKYKKFFEGYIIISYTFILVVWLNFSYHSFGWVPYNNLIFETFINNYFTMDISGNPLEAR